VNIKQKIEEIFMLQQKNRLSVGRTTAKQRIAKLKRIHQWMCDHKIRIQEALYSDFGRAAAEVDGLDIYPTIIEIKHAIRSLKRWMKPSAVKRTRSLITSRSHIRFEPKGMVLIISPWNFPLMLAMGPLVSAIAAGNCIILKPSELSPHTAHIIREMIGELFPVDEIAVIEGDKHVAIELLKKPFNHIFFTGSSDVGKDIMKAAAKNLSSVTLELGGKSPAIVDPSADIKDSAAKIAWGRFINTGQTCVAPDYIFVHERIFDSFIASLKSEVKKFYGETEGERQESAYFGRIIDQRHYQRLRNMIDDALANGANFEIGGISEQSEKYIAPTIITDMNLNALVMEEEIFGPILPIVKYNDLDEVTNIIKSKETPLAVYIFSKNKNNIEKIIQHTYSGNVCINEVVVQFIHYNLPFGGINHSGIGNSHGYFGFKAFSHERAVLKNNKYSLVKLVYPPYDTKTRKLIELMLKYL
jgi:aldehyde dehydrogenase (NAD+)